MSRVVVIGTNRRGHQAVLAVGTYAGTWTISGGELHNDRRIECTVTGHGDAHSVAILDCGAIVLAGPLGVPMALGRRDATIQFPVGGVGARQLRVSPDLVELLDVGAIAAIEAIA